MKTHRTAASQRKSGHSAWVLPGLLLALLLACAAPAHGAGVFRVDAASTAPMPDGQSWETAYPALQAAVNAAAIAGGGELWVKAGTYTSSAAEVVSLDDGVDVYGGFAGAETDRAQRDWKANPAVIDGQRARRGVTCTDGAPADDITGTARPQGAGVDMGAYESAPLGVPHAPVVGADGSGANPPTWTWTPGGGGIGQYRFGFSEGVWEIVDLAATAYTPPIPLPAGGHTLHVQERDAAGNWSASGTHTLTVADTAPPAGTVVINGNAATTASSTVALALTWDDGLNGSGVSRMRFSNDGIIWSPWERAASLKSWTLPAGTGCKTVRAQFLDRSGNRSAVCSDYIKVVAP